MDDKIQALRDAGQKPVVVHPGPSSIEDLLRNVDPAPDDETERFVAAIYADRRDEAESFLD
jgi:acetylglutamate kinase